MKCHMPSEVEWTTKRHSSHAAVVLVIKVFLSKSSNLLWNGVFERYHSRTCKTNSVVLRFFPSLGIFSANVHQLDCWFSLHGWEIQLYWESMPLPFSSHKQFTLWQLICCHRTKTAVHWWETNLFSSFHLPREKGFIHNVTVLDIYVYLGSSYIKSGSSLFFWPISPRVLWCSFSCAFIVLWESLIARVLKYETNFPS